MTPKKPSWFRFKDFLLFGGLTLFSLALTILVFSLDTLEAADGSGPIPTGAFGVHGLMVAVTLGFALVYGGLLYFRRQSLQDFQYIAAGPYAIMVDMEGYRGADLEDVKAEFQRTFNLWGAVFGSSEVNRAAKGLFWVMFRPSPIRFPGGPTRIDGKVAGLTVARTQKMYVGYKDPEIAIEKTALAHEIGHIIQAVMFGSWNETEHHKRSTDHGLP